MSTSIPIGMRCDLVSSHPGLEDELLHLPVRDLDAIDLPMAAAHRRKTGIELGHPLGTWPAVEVREAEVVPVPLEVVEEERELALVEDRLTFHCVDPLRRAELDPERVSGADELARLVREHPLGGLLTDEET